MQNPSNWPPTSFRRFTQSLPTSTNVCEVMTDAGPVFLKALGNPEGPHALARELIGTRLAQWFGLSTFEFAIMEIDAVDEIPLAAGGFAEPGPAFATRKAPGHVWDGAAEGLKGLANPEAVSRLIVFDTWIRNRDRRPPANSNRRPNFDNVFLQFLGAGQYRLLAIDHTHCLGDDAELSTRVRNIEQVKDDRLYGLFEGFRPHVRGDWVLAAIDRLRSAGENELGPLVEEIPEPWEVIPSVRKAILDFLLRRAEFVADTVRDLMARECWPGNLFDKRS